MEEIKIETKHNLGFAFIKKGYLAKFFMMIGFLKTYQLDNDNFNKNIYIASDSDIFCDSIKNNSQIQDLLIDIFAMNAYALRCDGRNLYFVCKTIKNNPKGREKLDKITSILNEINEILCELPSAKLPLDKLTKIYKAIDIITIFSMMFFVIYHIMDPKSSISRLVSKELLLDVWKYGSLTFLISLVVLAILFAGTSKFTSVLARSILILPNILVWGALTAASINVHFDSSPPDTQYLTVVEHTQGKRRSYRYNIKAVNYWDDAETKYNLLSDRNFYSRTRIGSKVRVTFRSGYLGYKWIDKQSVY